jgi:hypothetical protein
MDNRFISTRMTLRQFLIAIGHYLRAERERRHWNLVDVQYNGGPNYATVEQHENGHIRTFRKLQTHLTVFDANILDVFSEVFQVAMGQSDEISADVVEARRLLDQYYHTTSDGREALRRVAAVLPFVEHPSVPPSTLTAALIARRPLTAESAKTPAEQQVVGAASAKRKTIRRRLA